MIACREGLSRSLELMAEGLSSLEVVGEEAEEEEEGGEEKTS